MPWLKSSENLPTSPPVLRLTMVRGADSRTVNEVFGFVSRCAGESAKHMTDGAVDLAMATQFGARRTEKLLAQAVEAGLMTVSGRGTRRTWNVLQDEDAWHIRSRSDVISDRRHMQDRRNMDLRMPVLRRDGDVCRWCGKVVNWRAWTSGRTATLDHLNYQPGVPSDPAEVVIACLSCNSRRQGAGWTLLPVPALPYFSPQSSSLRDLTNFYGVEPPHTTVEPRPAGDASSDTRPAGPGVDAGAATPRDTDSGPSRGSGDTSGREGDTATRETHRSGAARRRRKQPAEDP